MDQMSVNLDRCGNTSAATILTALNLAIQDGGLREGLNILSAAFGAGSSSRAMVFSR